MSAGAAEARKWKSRVQCAWGASNSSRGGAWYESWVVIAGVCGARRARGDISGVCLGVWSRIQVRAVVRRVMESDKNVKGGLYAVYAGI